MGNALKDRAKEARLLAKEKSIPPWAKKVGVSSTAIYLIEDGTTLDLKAATAEAMARLSGLRAEWIRTGKGAKVANANNVHRTGQEPEVSPEEAIKRLQDSLQAIRVILSAVASTMTIHRPAEAADAARTIRGLAPAEFRDQGFAHDIASILEQAERLEKAARGAVRAPANPRSSRPK